MTADLAALTGMDVPTGLFIGGEWTTNGRTIGVTDPATEDTLVEISDGTPDDALAAVAAAEAALPGWAATPPRERAECLRKAWALMIERSEAIARLMVLENGKALRDARARSATPPSSSAGTPRKRFAWTARSGSLRLAPTGSWSCASRSGSACWSRRGTSRRQWRPARSARRWRQAARWCSSPASDTPLTALAMAETCWRRPGVPPGVVNVVCPRRPGRSSAPCWTTRGYGSSASQGRPRSAACCCATAAKTITNCSMELGGNAPFLIFEDADLEAAIEGAILAKMRNGGEACTAANRFYVPRPDCGRVLRPARRADGWLRVGPGWTTGIDLGPLVNDDARSQSRQPGRRTRSRQARRSSPAGRARPATAILPAHRADRRAARRGDPARGDLRPGRARVRSPARTRRCAGQRHRVRSCRVPLLR